MCAACAAEGREGRIALKARGGAEMKITDKTSTLKEETVVWLPSEEFLIIKEIIKANCGVYYKVQFVEEDGDEYVPIGDMRVLPHCDLIGGEID